MSENKEVIEALNNCIRSRVISNDYLKELLRGATASLVSDHDGNRVTKLPTIVAIAYQDSDIMRMLLEEDKREFDGIVNRAYQRFTALRAVNPTSKKIFSTIHGLQPPF